MAQLQAAQAKKDRLATERAEDTQTLQTALAATKAARQEALSAKQQLSESHARSTQLARETHQLQLGK